MLTRFFSKSKPVNFLTIAFFMALFFIWVNSDSIFTDFRIDRTLGKIAALATFILSISVLDFIARKNDLTKRSAFKMLFFAVFSLSFVAILKDSSVIAANFFVLLALRRIISLKSRKDIRKKLFDATFWICIASLFYFWSILFLFLVYAGILLHASTYFKNWLIPFVGIFIVFLMVFGFHLVAYNEFYHFRPWFDPSVFEFQNYKELRLLLPLLLIFGVSAWALLYYFGLMQKSSIRSRPTYILVFISFAISLAAVILAPTKDGSELLFLFVPLSIIISNFFESKGLRVVKEILLILLVVMPFLILLLP